MLAEELAQAARGLDGGTKAQHLLQQLAACITDVQKQHQLQDQAAGRSQCTPGAVLQAVQEGLRASDQQLGRLLAQQGRQLLNTPQDQNYEGQQQQQVSPSLAVLQKLLQLAVGNSCCDASTAAAAAAAAGYNRPPVTPIKASPFSSPLAALAQGPASVQQQQWHAAATQALQLFSVTKLSQLPPSSLQQALVLQPQLLDHLLEAAAAAVLQPVLPGSAATGAGHTAAVTAQAGFKMPQQATSSSSDGSRSVIAAQSMQALLAASCPWMQQLPGMLAHNPALLLKGFTTLLSWFEASGHNRLWQLLESTCRPAWRQLTTAVGQLGCTAAAPHAAGTDGLPPAAAGDSSSTCPSCCISGSPQLLVLAGSLQLLCPQPWQQQLVATLSQEPSLLGLLQLLRQLPGVTLMRAQQQRRLARQPQPQGEAVPTAADSTNGSRADMECDPTVGALYGDVLLSWPGASEWGQAAGVGDAAAGSEPVMLNTSQAKAAWGLVVQHYCWYQFACYLLVQASLGFLQQQLGHNPRPPAPQQHQATDPNDSWEAAASEVYQLLQLPLEELQQKRMQLTHPQQAYMAAAFLAWVQQPTDCDRQQRLLQQLLTGLQSCANKQKEQQRRQQQQQQQQQEQHQEQQQCSPLHCAKELLSHWSQACSADADAAKATGVALPFRDLPCAVLQQRQLLLAAEPQQLVQLCVTSTQVPPAISTTSVSGCAQDSSALSQLLDCSNGVCTAALEVANLSMQHSFQQQQQQQQRQQNTAAVGATQAFDLQRGLSWLGGLWLLGDKIGGGGVQPDGLQPVVVPDLEVAKRLLAAATSVDQQLKQAVVG